MTNCHSRIPRLSEHPTVLTLYYKETTWAVESLENQVPVCELIARR